METMDTGRRIYDYPFGAGGRRELPGACSVGAACFAVRGNGVDRWAILAANTVPLGARALWIVVHHRGLHAQSGEITRQIGRNRGFAATTLGVEYEYRMTHTQ